MVDDRIGTYGKPKPKLTIGGNPVQEQYRAIIGLGNDKYVIIGHSDIGYEDELEQLKAANKPIIRIHKKGATSGQKDIEETSK